MPKYDWHDGLGLMVDWIEMNGGIADDSQPERALDCLLTDRPLVRQVGRALGGRLKELNKAMTKRKTAG